MLNKQREEAVVTLCRELIQRQSYSGDEGAAVEKMKCAFHELGYDDVFVDSYGNVVGQIRGRRPGKSILLDGHIDTVPVPKPSKWKHAPFSGELEGGKIYGRGASNMKGALSAMISAAGFFAADNAKDFAGNIYVAGVVHEECFEGSAGAG
jgi:acetylornithine deacetylase/succinyl-diaminopimelate desuccinylase-like protein